MERRLSLVTLGVADLDAARAFYTEVLGWTQAPQSVGDVVFFQAGGVAVALYPRRLLAEDAGLAGAPARGFGGITLAHNVRERGDVDRILAEVAARGGAILKPAADAFWGGRTGYFADPDGFPWEVAWNPGFPLDAEGILRLEPPVRPTRTARRPAVQRRRARKATGPRARKRR